MNRKTIHVPEFNLGIALQQLQYGFEADALHHVAGEGGHVQNNMKILDSFDKLDKNYYTKKN